VEQLGESGEYYGKIESGLNHKFGALRWYPPPESIKADRLAPVSKFDCVLSHTGFYGVPQTE
jgi:hypothetical protein